MILNDLAGLHKELFKVVKPLSHRGLVKARSSFPQDFPQLLWRSVRSSIPGATAPGFERRAIGAGQGGRRRQPQRCQQITSHGNERPEGRPGQAAEEVERMTMSGQSLSVDQRIRNRRDHAFAARLARDAVEAVFSAVGGTGLASNQPIQRMWRDSNAIVRHITLNWDGVSSMVGQHLLGLTPKGQY